MQLDLSSLNSRVIFPLDTSDADELYQLVVALGANTAFMKCGLETIFRFGPDIIRKVTDMGAPVFADGKIHDVTATTREAARIYVERGAVMQNIHLGNTSHEALRAFVEICGDTCAPMGVTLLTDITDQQCVEENGCTREEYVLRLALKAVRFGINVIICAATEAAALRREFGDTIIIVCPAIRPVWSVAGEQKNIVTPADAIEQDVDLLVCGSPIRKYPKHQGGPAEGLRLVNTEVALALVAKA